MFCILFYKRKLFALELTRQEVTFENQDITDNNSSQILRNNDPVDVGLMKWFSVKFLWFISKFNITFAAAQFILALIYSLLVLLSHPVQDIFAATLFRVQKLARVDEYKHTYHRFIVYPNNSCNTLYTQDSSFGKCKTQVDRLTGFTGLQVRG